ncbi:MAG: caspase family protein [Candidatus Kapabacteria bacterium]|nr:caspase family protein [Candidatus Kapabacteria bacterium]
MKYFYLIILLFLASQYDGFSQCVSGDCNNGKGVKKFDNGDRYEGQFKEGRFNGKGTYFYADGDKYVGDFVDGFKEGKGKYFYKNGKVYDGEWKENNRNGQGTETYPDGSKYTGGWKDGRQHGYGVTLFSDGAKYEGEWKDNLQNGQGTYIWADGDKYVGEWLNGKRHGKGKYTWASGASYDGDWKFNNQEGFGTYIWPVGDKYTGEWKDNLHHGKGKLWWADGDYYDGEWKEGFRDGYGTYIFANGEKYVGEFKRDQFHGKGIWYYKDGTSTVGIWEYDQFLENTSIDTDIEGEKSKIWAIVVGISKYNHNKSLRYTKDDAYRFYAFLKSPEGGALPDKQIKLLIDEDATKQKILSSMRQIYSQAGKNDVIMMYFAGHGVNGAFLAFDGYDHDNLVPHGEVNRIFAESKAKYKLCIADACNSGSLDMAQRGEKDQLELFYKEITKGAGGTALMMSSKSDETSGEFEGLRQGVFSYYLIKGLKGEADSDANSLITIKELFAYVKNNVSNFTNYNQNPVLNGNFDENMPIGVVIKK